MPSFSTSTASHGIRLPQIAELQDNLDCNICWDPFFSGEVQEIPIRLPCRHIFGNNCILKWFKPLSLVPNNACPECRRPILNDPGPIGTSVAGEEYSRDVSRRFEAFWGRVEVLDWRSAEERAAPNRSGMKNRRGFADHGLQNGEALRQRPFGLRNNARNARNDAQQTPELRHQLSGPRANAPNGVQQSTAPTQIFSERSDAGREQYLMQSDGLIMPNFENTLIFIGIIAYLVPGGLNYLEDFTDAEFTAFLRPMATDYVRRDRMHGSFHNRPRNWVIQVRRAIDRGRREYREIVQGIQASPARVMESEQRLAASNQRLAVRVDGVIASRRRVLEANERLAENERVVTLLREELRSMESQEEERRDRQGREEEERRDRQGREERLRARQTGWLPVWFQEHMPHLNRDPLEMCFRNFCTILSSLPLLWLTSVVLLSFVIGIYLSVPLVEVMNEDFEGSMYFEGGWLDEVFAIWPL